MVKLWVALVGRTGGAFAVTINEGEDVNRLKLAIKEKRQSTVTCDASELQLYLAKNDDGAWMTDDEADGVKDVAGLEQLRYGRHVLSRVGLSGVDAARVSGFNEDEGPVHVLALMATDLLLLGVKDSDAVTSYRATAQHLKDCWEVQSLSEQLAKVVEQPMPTPFVVLENSSGMGKTQMAFNLEAQGEWDVFHLVCSDTSDQSVYGAYEQRMHTFEDCIRRDVEALERGMFYWHQVQLGGVGQIRNQDTLGAYGFVIAALRGVDTFGGVATRCDVEKELQLRRERGAKPIVFFLDEFPRIRQQHTSLLDKDQWKRESVPRIMRNVFRSFGLAVVVSGRSETGRKLFAIGRRDLQAGPYPWCVVAPSLPRVVITENVDVFPMMKKIIAHSRPLFAQKAIQYIQDHPYSEKESTVAAYLDAMACSLSPLFASLKDEQSAEFEAGQLGLLLHCTNSSPIPVSDDVDLIDGHFARLLDTSTAIEVTLAGDSALSTNSDFWKGGSGWKIGTPWVPLCLLPSPEEDVLLHLTLTSFHPFKSRLHRVVSPTILRSDTKHLASLSAAAMVVASHIGGFGGVAFPLFLRELLMEMGLTDPDEESAKHELPEKIAGWASMVVPFLSPANASWPVWLQDSSTRFDSLTQRNSGDDLVHVRTASNVIAVDCASSNSPVDLGTMVSILKMTGARSMVHLVVVNSLQPRYFPAKEAWETISREQDLQRVAVNRLTNGSSLTEIPGMPNRRSDADKLMLFIELRE